MNGIYLLLGSNLGQRLEHLTTALSKLHDRGVDVLRVSSVYETEPWGKSDQPWFLNVVAEISTRQSAVELLRTCLEVEQALGRLRTEKWGARVIDIDVLFYYDQVLDHPQLTLPHPGIPDRRFVLLPLQELCADEIHPGVQRSISELVQLCPDTLQCRKTDIVLAP